jgi:hypothetical protein
MFFYTLMAEFNFLNSAISGFLSVYTEGSSSNSLGVSADPKFI